VLAATLLHAYGWHAMFWVLGALGFVWFAAWLLIFRKPEDARWLSDREREKILAERSMRADEAAADPAHVKAVMKALLSNRTVWVLAAVEGCAVYTQYLFLTWLPGYLEKARGMSVLSGGLYTAIPYAVAVVGGIALGVVSDRLLRNTGAHTGRRRRAVAAALLASAVVLAAPFVPATWMALALVSVSLMCVSTSISLNIALTNDLLRERSWAGQANSLVILGGNILGLLAPIVTGFIVSATGGFTGGFIIAGALLVLGCVLVLTMTHQPITDPEGTSQPDSAAEEPRSTMPA
jgi:ACS family glucarate transporter-like MFS transporter